MLLLSVGDKQMLNFLLRFFRIKLTIFFIIVERRKEQNDMCIYNYPVYKVAGTFNRSMNFIGGVIVKPKTTKLVMLLP